jgi:hypothetical protein
VGSAPPTPLSETVVGEVSALVSILRVADRLPDACGEKRTVSWQLELGAMAPPQVVEPTKKSIGSVPVNDHPVTYRGAEPWLVTVTVCGPLVVCRGCVPGKVRCDEDGSAVGTA